MTSQYNTSHIHTLTSLQDPKHSYQKINDLKNDINKHAAQLHHAHQSLVKLKQNITAHTKQLHVTVDILMSALQSTHEMRCDLLSELEQDDHLLSQMHADAQTEELIQQYPHIGHKSKELRDLLIECNYHANNVGKLKIAIEQNTHHFALVKFKLQQWLQKHNIDATAIPSSLTIDEAYLSECSSGYWLDRLSANHVLYTPTILTQLDKTHRGILEQQLIMQLKTLRSLQGETSEKSLLYTLETEV